MSIAAIMRFYWNRTLMHLVRDRSLLDMEIQREPQIQRNEDKAGFPNVVHCRFAGKGQQHH